MTEQAKAGEAAMAKMPEPVEFDLGGALGGFAGGGDPMALVSDVQAANEQARAAHECAVDVMCELESCAGQVDGATPPCPPQPPDVANGPQDGFTPTPLADGPSLGQSGELGAFGPAGGAGTSPSSVTGPSAGGGWGSAAGPSGTGGLPRPSAPSVAPVLPGPQVSTGSMGASGRSAGSGFGGGKPGGGAPPAPRVSSGAGGSGRAGGFGPPPGGRTGAVPPGDAGRAATRPNGGFGPGSASGSARSGMLGAPGSSASGHGGDIEHRLAGYLTGEKLFEPVTCSPPVIGDADCVTGRHGGALGGGWR